MDKNNYFLGLYEKAMPNDIPIKRKLHICKESGFDHMEISIDETDEKLSRLFDGFEKELNIAIRETECPVRTMCLSGHRKYPLGSTSKEKRDKSLEIMYRAIQFASVTNIRIIQLAGYDVYYEESSNETIELFLENLYKSVLYANKYGINLAFETMETPFMDTISKAMCYINQINSPYLGVYPDIGNLQNACNKYNLDIREEIRSANGHIMATHLKETLDGVYRDMDFGTGHTNYEVCIDELYKQGVSMFTGEFWYHKKTDIEKIETSLNFLKNKLNKNNF